MKQNVLSRYERDSEGRIVIDVSATRVQDLYDNFDKSAPYIRRDLDQDLAEYLIDCAREVSRNPFIIRFTLLEPPDEPTVCRIQRSVYTYFIYLKDIEMRMIMQMFRRSAILFGIGICILFISVSFNRLLETDRSVVANVVAEGLTIAAWVSMWEALAVFLIEWLPHRKNLSLYQHLAHARQVFRAAPAGGYEPDHTTPGVSATTDRPQHNHP
ncbi:hypothetical protein [Desulforhopalus singaporensis]|uniref:Uncharacterized protein n=1 Tax=Desulforhopalus singaporensis TaxID=91360 RepID=A0A1H0QXR0_9BACT|nr:hypothetical protein [Desulforhopalus singaporensis]SDP22081.1 hypothetical protein SAMN05660330_02122 [Desulforhopalus singaporensis]